MVAAALTDKPTEKVDLATQASGACKRVGVLSAFDVCEVVASFPRDRFEKSRVASLYQ